jgi:hypothetical protein
VSLPKPGLHRGIGYDTYARWDAVRSSELKLFDRTPAHARYALTHPEETSAQLLGNATHTALLEPERFATDYVCAPKLDMRTNAGKAEWAEFIAEHKDQTALKADEFAHCQALLNAVQQHPLASAILRAPGFTEVSLLWADEQMAFHGKARLDRFCTWDGYSTIIDVKTARDASPRGFARDAANLGYHLQAAWYLRGADALSPVARRFVFLVVEKEPPHCVALYELEEDFLAKGRAAVERALRAYATAKETGAWPGYPQAIQTLNAPAWLQTPEENAL